MSFVVYKSSAGSGKTFTLVKEYLTIVLKEPDKFRHILAITFTNKAANEMKERVIVSLKELSAKPFSTNSNVCKYLLPDLIKETNLDEEVIVERAEKVLELILHNYSDFAISTIDSFVHKIVRTFAYDLHIPMNFEVELDSDKLITQSVDLLINQIGIDDNITKILSEFAESKTDDEKNWHIEDDLKKFAFSLLNEDGQLQLDKLKNLSIEDFFKIRNKINELVKIFENTVIKHANTAHELIKSKNISHSAFYRTNSGIGKYFENLIKNKNSDSLSPNSYVTTTIDEDKWYSTKADASEKAAIDSIKSELINAFNNIQDLLAEHYQQYMLMTLINKNIYPIAVLNEIQKIITEIKTENNIVHISEFNKRIAEIVMKEPVPFIYERLGEKYKHFLIDEFQDTSVLQWQNLLPLLENSLAEGNFNMVVGDGKQAIYRWRNGDVEQFARLPEIPNKLNNPILKEREESLIRNYNGKNLIKNFRSKTEIIEFNNKFFKEIGNSLPEPYRSIYDNLEQELNPANKGGYISIEFLDKTNKETPLDELNNNRIKEIIDKLKVDKFELKDIAILCRSNKNASEIARYLMEQGINVVSSESLLLGKSPVVNFITATIRFIHNPQDDITKAEIIHFLVNTNKIITTGLHDELAEVVKNKSIEKFLAYLSKHGYSFHVQELVGLPIYDMCEKIIRIFNLNIPPLPDTQFYLDAVHKYTLKKHNDNITDFLEWWNEQKDKTSIIVPEGINAVRIMTIHKSKGLEFPVVIYPFANERIKMTKDSIWVDLNESQIPELTAALIPTERKLAETAFKELYDEENNKSRLDVINLMYVVMTRPSERLYVLTNTPTQKLSEQKSVPDIFAHYLQTVGQWEEGKNTYTFGEPSLYKQTNKHEQEKSELKTFISSEWQDRIQIKIKAHKLWDFDAPQKNKLWGKLVHTALSKIKTYEDIDQILNNMLLEGLIDNEENSRLNKKLNELINTPAIKPYFEKGLNVKTEAEILTTEGRTFIPDRLILDDTKAIIIDYKTGEPEEKHTEQINRYAQMLSQMGYMDIQKLLIYVEENKIANV